jgi:branched-chain amino acid aminotransferase
MTDHNVPKGAAVASDRAVPPAVAPPTFAWLNGEIVPFDRCVVHARSQGAFWGANVFEGLRAYWRADERRLHVFRLPEHLARLRRSMKSVWMEVPYSDAEVTRACLDVVHANEFAEDVHMVIVGYFGMGPNLDSLSHTDDAGMHITATRMPRAPGYHGGVTASIASWRRIGDDAMPPRIKTGANYHNSRLAHHEAVRNGFDTALLLNQRGNLSEAPGSCVVMVRDGRLATPPSTSGVLEGITLATVAELADELGLVLERREIDRTELYVADELFLCGTLVEVRPIVSIDRLPVGTGAPGPVTRALQERYERAVRAAPEYADRGWTLPVPTTPTPTAPPLATVAGGGAG